MGTVKHLKRRSFFTSLVFAFAIVLSQFNGVLFAHAAGATDVWTGTAGDNKFSTATNWSSSTVPSTGDILQFNPLTTGSSYQNIYLLNDLSNVTFAGIITTSNSISNNVSTQFNINTITFANNATISTTGSGTKSAYVYFSTSGNFNNGTINGLGNLTVGANASLAGNIQVAGNLIVNGSVYAMPTSNITGNIISQGGLNLPDAVGGSITLSNNNEGLTVSSPSRTITNAFILGNGDSGNPTMGFGNCSVASQSGGGVGVNCATYANATYVLSGNITLTGNVVINVASLSTVQLTGAITYNGYTITKDTTSAGTLQIGGTTVEIPVVTTLISDSNPSAAAIVNNQQTTTLDGTRGTVIVSNGGVLKGTGTANNITVSTGGTIAPGHSPGTMTVVTTYNQGGVYQAELQTKNSYDQIVVGSPSDTTGNDVTLASTSTLDTILYSGYSINTGDTFKIIDNKSQTPVSGIFQGLPEGTHFTAGTIAFSISYVGGDGNDVVLTALTSGTAPKTPNTAVKQLILANPLLSLAIGIGAAGLLIFIGRKKLQRN